MYTDGSNHTLATGTTTALGTGTWHNLSFTFQGSQISAELDGNQFGSVTDTSFSSGQAGLGIQGYRTDQFDNLDITPGTGGGPVGTPGGTGAVVSANGGKCLDDDTGSTANGNKIQIRTCNNSTAQQVTIGTDGTLQMVGKCVEATGNGGTANGTLVELWDCNGGNNQKWTYNSSTGALVNPQSGRCLDVPNASTTDGTQLDLWDCNTGDNQRWTVPTT
jgi:hypothetical protein